MCLRVRARLCECRLLHTLLLDVAEGAGGLIAGAQLHGVGGGAGCRRLWVGAALVLGVEIPNRCCLWLLRAGRPCSSLQCLPSARARGPLFHLS